MLKNTKTITTSPGKLTRYGSDTEIKVDDNVVGYGSDQDDWYTLGQLKRAIKFYEGQDLKSAPMREARDIDKSVFKRFLKGFVRKGRESDEA